MPDDLHIATRIVHAGERQGPPTGEPVVTPIYASATFTYPSMAEVDKVFSGEKPGYVYTRHGNPTVNALAEAVRELEGGAAACAYGSGMAALHAALLVCELSPGTVVLASQDLYGATLQLLLTIFGSFGVNTITADFSDLRAVEQKAREYKPKLLLVETISNPLLKICDVAACAELAHEVGALLLVDNTFATPYLCRPLEFGADLVVHSATKYLGGHAAVTGGVVVARDAAYQPLLVSAMKLAGGILGPAEAHQILLGIKTLALRMERQCANARHLAVELSTDRRVARVHYPALTDAPAQQILRRMLRSPHAGALVSIEVGPNTREAAFRFMDALRLCVRSTSLGDVFTGVLHPATASHRDVPPARRQQLGITDGLVRISVGIEDVNDILADLRQALDAAAEIPTRERAAI
jgi:cystathionine beta-lyase/cystathionine gamma-synthase